MHHSTHRPSHRFKVACATAAERVQEEAAERAAANRPVLQAPMTSELGNITPVVIVPGAWAPKDLRTAAQLVAFNMADNAGCNCLSPKVVVLAEDWPQVLVPSSPTILTHRVKTLCSRSPPSALIGRLALSARGSKMP